MGNDDKYAQYPERTSDSRVRYFDGQFLGSQDFIDEQRHHIDRLRRVTRHLRVRGVAEGLGVAATGVLKVKVEPGTAIDDRGRQLVLTAERELGLPADLPRPGNYALYIIYAEKTDRTLGGTADQKGTRGDTRFREDPQLGVYAVDDAAPPSAVGLALLTIDGAGAVVVSTPPEQRAYSGLRLGGPTGNGPSLGTGGDLRPQELVVNGGLRVQGALSVRDGVIQNGATPIQGTSDLGLYSQTPGGGVRLVNHGGSFTFSHDGGVGLGKTHEFHPDGAVTLHWPKNPLRFTSGWTNFGDGGNKAEISNDTGEYRCLMVVGNATSGAGRTVGVWDHLRVAGRLRVVQGISVNNANATRALQIGGESNGIGMDPSEAAPNAGYIRFGDTSGWRLHFARARENANAALNQGPAGILMTVHDSGQLGIGTPNPSEQVRLRTYAPSVANQWSGRIVAGGDRSVVVVGEVANQAVIGAHAPALNAWADLVINPGGKIGVGTNSLENAPITMQGPAVLRVAGVAGWDRLVVNTTKDWGEGENQHVTIGAGGAAGIMLSNPHVSWRDGRASIRYGRTGGVSGGTIWDVGLRGDGSYTLVASDGGADGGEKLRIDRSGAARFTSTLLVGSNRSPEGGAALTVDGTTVLRTGGIGGWDRLVVTATKEWGDGEHQHVTLGSGGAVGIMLSNPHVTWRDGRASIRYGRTNGQPGDTFWDAGVRSDGSFSVIPLDNNPGHGVERLKLDRNGDVTLGGRAPLRLSHGWTSFPDDAGRAGAEISNDIDNYKTLMIIGNKSAGGERRVGLWDRVDVNGFLQINQSDGDEGLRITNFTDRNIHMNIRYEGNNNTCVFYHQNGLGNYMRQDGAWQRHSDRSLKRDVAPLDDALALALQLRPVRFTWKATDTRCLGFIAQDVAPLFPELVSESPRIGEDGRKLLGLKYENFGVVAIAAVQQLKHELEAKIAALDAQLRELATARR